MTEDIKIEIVLYATPAIFFQMAKDRSFKHAYDATKTGMYFTEEGIKSIENALQKLEKLEEDD